MRPSIVPFVYSKRAAAARSLRKLRTLSPPTSSRACEAGEATTCTLSVALSCLRVGRDQALLRSVLGVHVESIFPSFEQIVKLAAHG